MKKIIAVLALMVPFSSAFALDTNQYVQEKDIYSYYHDSMESDMVGESILGKLEFIEKWQAKAREDIKNVSPQDRQQIKKFLRVSLSDWKYWRMQVKDWEYRKHFK